MRGRRRTPGRPVTYGNYRRVRPFRARGGARPAGMDEPKGARAFFAHARASVPQPVDPDLLAEDEDPLTGIDPRNSLCWTPRVTNDERLSSPNVAPDPAAGKGTHPIRKTAWARGGRNGCWAASAAPLPGDGRPGSPLRRKRMGKRRRRCYHAGSGGVVEAMGLPFRGMGQPGQVCALSASAREIWLSARENDALVFERTAKAHKSTPAAGSG